MHLRENAADGRTDLVCEFELSKAISFSVLRKNWRASKPKRNNRIEFREIVPIERIDPVCFQSCYYLAPSRGAEKWYRLLAETLEDNPPRLP